MNETKDMAVGEDEFMKWDSDYRDIIGADVIERRYMRREAFLAGMRAEKSRCAFKIEQLKENIKEKFGDCLDNKTNDVAGGK